jgi:hypothetical protein
MIDHRRALTVARWLAEPTAAQPMQAAFLVAAGAPPVALAHAASVLERSVQGDTRVGAWLPVRRMEVSWSLDTQSNGDFKCMAPSNPQARWEVLAGDLAGDLARTGADAGAWIETLARLGLTTVVIGVDMQDDRDLDLCAGLIERWGPLLWFSPLTPADADLAAWVEFGQVARLVLPSTAAGTALAAPLLARFGSPRPAAELAT